MTEVSEAGRFSPSDAALAGFGVIRRHWRVVVGWALFNLVAMVAMVVVTVVLAVGLAFATGAGEAEGVAEMVGGGLALLGALVTEAVMAAGVYRLMLRPDEPAFLHLRLSADELRLGVLLVLWIALWAAAVMLWVAGTVVLRSLGPGFSALWALVCLALFAALAVRFSLAMPMTFAARRFQVAAAWRASRGHVWSLIGMVLLSACLVMVVALAAWLAFMLLSGTLSGFRGVLSAGGDMEGHPARYLLQAAAEVMFAPVLWILAQAPYAAAYRALVGRGA